MTIHTDRLTALNTIRLDNGSHKSFDDGHCAMEVVSWLAGEEFTDAPQCASPVLRTFTINLNDSWNDKDRQKLVPFLPRMVGTGGDGKDDARSYLALDWLIRTHTPAWLDLAGLTAEAQALRDLRRIVDMAAAESAGPVVQEVQSKAAAAGDAAWATAWDAAWATARDAAGEAARAAARAAARDAARSTAGATAWDAAGSAARHAARATARAAARAAARDAARSTAGATAWDAAGSAAGEASWAAAWAAAGDAARDAAREALLPTVETLQASALDLLDRMIDPPAVQS